MTWKSKTMPNSALTNSLVGTMLNGQADAPAPAAAPDFRALCKDLVDDLEAWMEYGKAPANLPLEEDCTWQLIKRARAALKVKP